MTRIRESVGENCFSVIAKVDGYFVSETQLAHHVRATEEPKHESASPVGFACNPTNSVLRNPKSNDTLRLFVDQWFHVLRQAKLDGSKTRVMSATFSTIAKRKPWKFTNMKRTQLRMQKNVFRSKWALDERRPSLLDAVDGGPLVKQCASGSVVSMTLCTSPLIGPRKQYSSKVCALKYLFQIPDEYLERG